MRSFFSTLALLTSTSLLALAANTITYTFQNNCPNTVPLIVNCVEDGYVQSGKSVTRNLGVDAGPFWTTAHGGNLDGVASVRAGFHGAKGFNYYITKDAGIDINVPMGISTSNGPEGGWCASAECDTGACGASKAFALSVGSSPPFPPFPPAIPPSPPLYSCPIGGSEYTVTFCPNSVFTPGWEAKFGQEIHPNWDKSKCLDVRGANYQDGTPVQIYDCNGTGAQKWIIKPSGQLQVAGQNFCLDATYPTPGDGVQMKIWTCLPGVDAQKWNYNSNRFTLISAPGKCLDLPNGNKNNWNRIQVWGCSSWNPNQAWTL